MTKNYVMAALAVGFATLIPIAGGCASGEGEHGDSHVGTQSEALAGTGTAGRVSPIVVWPIATVPIATATGTATAVPTATATATSTSALPTVPSDLCLKTFKQKYEGFYCMDKSCAQSGDPFLEFEYQMYSSACLAGGTPPSSTHPTGVRGVVAHIDVNKQERLWLYGVCPMDDVTAKEAVTKYQKVDPVASFIAYYCYPDGVTSTQPTRTHIPTTGTPWTESAIAFVPVWDPRCGACVNGDGLVPPPPPFQP